MKRLILAASLMAVLTATVVVYAAGDEYLAYAVVKEDIKIPDRREGDLPEAQAGDVLDALHRVDHGYIVLCTNVAPWERFAFIPERDERGHEAVRSWLYESGIKDHTVEVISTVQLTPAYMLLKQGERLPVVDANAGTYTVRYTFAGLQWDLPLIRSAVTIERIPAAPADTVDPRQQRREKLLGEIESETMLRSDLEERILQTEEDSREMTELIKELNQVRIENQRLLDDLDKADRIYHALSEYRLSDKVRNRMEWLQAELAMLKDEQSALVRQLLRDEIEAGALATLHEDLLEQDGDLMTLAGDTIKKQSELTAAVEFPSDKDNYERNVMRGLYGDVIVQQADGRTELQRRQLTFDLLNSLTEVVASTQSENDELRTELDTLREKLNALYEQIDAMRKAADGADADAPDDNTP